MDFENQGGKQTGKKRNRRGRQRNGRGRGRGRGHQRNGRGRGRGRQRERGHQCNGRGRQRNGRGHYEDEYIDNGYCKSENRRCKTNYGWSEPEKKPIEIAKEMATSKVDITPFIPKTRNNCMEFKFNYLMVTATQAEAILRSSNETGYIIRPSSQPGIYSCTLYYQGVITHVRGVTPENEYTILTTYFK